MKLRRFSVAGDKTSTPAWDCLSWAIYWQSPPPIYVSCYLKRPTLATSPSNSRNFPRRVLYITCKSVMKLCYRKTLPLLSSQTWSYDCHVRQNQGMQVHGQKAKESLSPLIPSAPAPAAVLSSAYLLSNPFPSKPSIIFPAQKPFYSQPDYFSWWLGIFWCLFHLIYFIVPRRNQSQGQL